MLGVSNKEVFKYATLPGIGVRLRGLFMTGFQHIPYFMALVYQAVRLLPPGHPYGRSENIGKFGIGDVVAQAANNLVLKSSNIDQIVVFVTLLVGIIIAIIEICLMAFSMLSGPVMAAMPNNFSGFFVTPTASQPQDLAYMMLDLVFGIPHMFGSCVDLTLKKPCLDINGVGISDTTGNWILGGTMNNLQWPQPIHEGLHQMFQMYSTGLLVVAALITSYFIMTILLETAETGTAFGKRFNKVWAPVRLVMAFGLLIPVGYGLNSAQYMVLYAAKFGSSFATNGWNLFNASLTGNYLGDASKLISEPNTPEVTGLVQFMYTAGVCFYLEYIENGRQVWPYAVRDNASAPSNFLLINDSRVTGEGASGSKTTYQDLINFLHGDKQAVIRFGIQSEKDNPSELGYVRPICGELILPLADPRDPTSDTNPPARPAVIMQAFFFALIRDFWYNTFDGTPGPWAPTIRDNFAGHNYLDNTARDWTQWKHDPNLPQPESDYKNAIITDYKRDVFAALTDPSINGVSGLDPLIKGPGAKKEAMNSTGWAASKPLLQKGWAAAGIWYNKVAEMNGQVSAAALNIPIASKYPKVMENVLAAKQKQDPNISSAERYKPELSGNQDVPEKLPPDAQKAMALWQAYSFWQKDDSGQSSRTQSTGNPMLDAINTLFGTSGLFSLNKNRDVNPLAQLVGIGRSLVEAGTRNIAYIALGAALPIPKALVSISTTMIWSVTMVALTAGFLLFYVIPFLPFLYFFFAVSGWVKAIFEAMVGMPLWALAHIRIDGEGLPGRAALNGYFLIFEIFLRPILIVFGLLASISIFSAFVSVLNQTWDLVTPNISGFDADVSASDNGTVALLEFMRGSVDSLFFTVIYAVVVYMMAISSFKLIDQIPGNILRWMGQSVSPFNDAKEGLAESFMGATTYASQQGIQSLGGKVGEGLEKINSKKST